MKCVRGRENERKEKKKEERKKSKCKNIVKGREVKRAKGGGVASGTHY